MIRLNQDIFEINIVNRIPVFLEKADWVLMSE